MIDMNLGQQLWIGAKWDKVDGKNIADLDATVVLIDEVGKVADACYYNKQRSDCNSVVHSGDQVTGDKEGYDESITVNLPTINYTVSYLAILVSNAKGTGFNDQKASSIAVYQGSTLLTEIYLGRQDPSTNSVLVSLLRRVNPTWSYINVSTPGPGKNFTESENMIRSNLSMAGFDPVMLQETANWNGQARRFDMVKDQVIYLPKQCPNVNVCLGWNAGCDVDCSILQFDQQGNYYDMASFMKK